MVKLSKIADQPQISPHILRHTHCSLLFQAGTGLKEVQARLGHETIDITLEIYNHVSNRKLKEAVTRLVDFMKE